MVKASPDGGEKEENGNGGNARTVAFSIVSAFEKRAFCICLRFSQNCTAFVSYRKCGLSCFALLKFRFVHFTEIYHFKMNVSYKIYFRGVTSSLF